MGDVQTWHARVCVCSASASFVGLALCGSDAAEQVAAERRGESGAGGREPGELRGDERQHREPRAEQPEGEAGEHVLGVAASEAAPREDERAEHHEGAPGVEELPRHAAAPAAHPRRH